MNRDFSLKQHTTHDERLRRISQNRRLIERDLPWLSALRAEWNLALDVIKVIGEKNHMVYKEFLLPILRQAHLSDNRFEVSVRYVAPEKTGVIKIEPEEIPLAQAILNVLPEQADIQYINLVRRSGAAATIDVYRRDGEQPFNSLIREAAGL